MQHLEIVATTLIQSFDIQSPPIPIESMLQNPHSNMWTEVDAKSLTLGFTVREAFAPRMSLARLLARHIIKSDWGATHDLDKIVKDKTLVHAFARMLVMPYDMVNALSSGARNPTTMSFHFEVPETDARQRLLDLASYRP